MVHVKMMYLLNMVFFQNDVSLDLREGNSNLAVGFMVDISN